MHAVALDFQGVLICTVYIGGNFNFDVSDGLEMGSVQENVCIN